MCGRTLGATMQMSKVGLAVVVIMGATMQAEAQPRPVPPVEKPAPTTPAPAPQPPRARPPVGQPTAKPPRTVPGNPTGPARSGGTGTGTSTTTATTPTGPATTPSLLFKKTLNSGTTNLKGFVDLHTHPMAHLGMGGKLMHGAPDKDVLMPAGAIYDSKGVGVSGSTCNATDRAAASAAEALGSCYSTHGGHDAIRNKCGNHVRKIVVDGFEDGNKTNKPHDEPHPPGWPTFTKWPRHDDLLHQQMWVDWIKRAHAGGLRVIVALSVNSVTLGKGLAANTPYDDAAIGDRQLSEMKKLAARHSTWMEIAYSAADLRRIVGQDKLAVILGSELDDIGSFAWFKKNPKPSDVAAEIDRLYKDGLRYVFPVHVIDNVFGGTAIYEGEFPRASRYHFGAWPKIVCADAGDRITSRLGAGWDVFKALTLGEAGGVVPLPKCADGVGYKNDRGLQELGKVAIEEMMKRGMMIDVDHASQKTVDGILALAASRPNGGYPVVSGHNGLREGAHATENARTAEQYKKIAAGKGIAGIGLGGGTAAAFIDEARRVLRAAPGLSIHLGSDINGFVKLPGPESCTPGTCVVYDETTFPKPVTAQKTWDYNKDGVAHIGLFPDFLRRVENVGGKDVVDKLFEGAEGVARMWEQAERAR